MTVSRSRSRKTFRDPAHGVAWQRQLRDHYEHEGAPNADLELKRAVVRRVSYAQAKQIILKYEWLGTMSSTSHHFGIFYGMHCAGVTCVGTTATSGHNAHKPYGLKHYELGTLARGACVHWAPPGTNSKLVAWTVRMLARTTALKLILAYADTDAGEIGTIYQACGWTYIGKTTGGLSYVGPNGRVYDVKIVYDTLRSHNQRKTISWSAQRDHMLKHGWTEQRVNPKHRYVQLVDAKDDRLRARVDSMSKPYPKREHASVV